MNETSSALAAGQAAWLQQRAACLARLANRPPMPSVEVTGHPAAKERAKALGAWREVMRLGELLLGEAGLSRPAAAGMFFSGEICVDDVADEIAGRNGGLIVREIAHSGILKKAC